MRFTRSRKIMIMAAVATVTAFVGVAYAAFDGVIMGSDGVIYACAKTDGTVRLAGSSKTCDSTEKAFNWNQRGRTGPTGPQGAPGQPGPAYFARVATTDNQTDRSNQTMIQTWSYTDFVWVYMPYIDVRKCAVDATAVTAQTGALVTRAALDYDHWIGLYTNVNASRAQYPVDVTVACPATDNPWTASY
jgi:hypothetical protein